MFVKEGGEMCTEVAEYRLGFFVFLKADVRQSQLACGLGTPRNLNSISKAPPAAMNQNKLDNPLDALFAVAVEDNEELVIFIFLNLFPLVQHLFFI